MAERRYQIFTANGEVVIIDRVTKSPIKFPAVPGSLLQNKWAAIEDDTKADAFVDGALSMYLEVALQMKLIGVR